MKCDQKVGNENQICSLSLLFPAFRHIERSLSLLLEKTSKSILTLQIQTSQSPAPTCNISESSLQPDTPCSDSETLIHLSAEALCPVCSEITNFVPISAQNRCFTFMAALWADWVDYYVRWCCGRKWQFDSHLQHFLWFLFPLFFCLFLHVFVFLHSLLPFNKCYSILIKPLYLRTS